MFRVYMAGGGTGGHLFPGISLAQAIRSKELDAEIKFIISGRKLDGSLLEDKGFACVRIEQRHLPQHPKQLGEFMLTNARALWQVARLILKDRPDVIVGLGGYASFAAAAAAKLCGVPLVLLEQNVVPGKANRTLALAADRVFCQWKQAARYFLRRDNLRFKGNPVRESLRKLSKGIARARLGLSTDCRTLLVLGGSQGASALNNAMTSALPSMNGEAESVQVIHLAGKTEAELVRRSYADAGVRASVHDFLMEMQLAYSAADLAFCRAGGTTIAELTAMGLPCVLVPFPHATQNHQLANATSLASIGAAVVLEEKDITTAAIRKTVFGTLADEETLARMSACARLAGRPAAASEIAESIIGLFRTRRRKSFAQLLNV